MSSREINRLVRTTIVGCAMVLIAYFTVATARAEETQTDVIFVASLCAASNSLVATKSEGVFAEALFAEALFWADFTRSWVGDVDKANQILESVVNRLSSHYNSGGMTWDDMVEMAEECTNNIKPELLKAIESQE